eukprot:11017200-Heterocapsa_arctica.AAC.1
MSEEVTEDGLLAAWAALLAATVLVATKTTTAFANNVGLYHFGDEWLTTVPVWSEDAAHRPVVRWQWLRRNTKIMTTRNTDLDKDFNNGTEAR